MLFSPERPSVARFDFQEFLARTGLSLQRLASYLQVAQPYLEAAAAGQGRLTVRDQEACRQLWRRLFGGRQLELPFPEDPETLMRGYARRLARPRAPETTSLPQSPRRAPDRPRGATRRRTP
jgi:hypothetical protein